LIACSPLSRRRACHRSALFLPLRHHDGPFDLFSLSSGICFLGRNRGSLCPFLLCRSLDPHPFPRAMGCAWCFFSPFVFVNGAVQFFHQDGLVSRLFEGPRFFLQGGLFLYGLFSDFVFRSGGVGGLPGFFPFLAPGIESQFLPPTKTFSLWKKRRPFFS